MKAVKNKSRLLLGLRKSPADLHSAKFIHYYGPTYVDSAIYDLEDFQSILNDEKFDKNKNTVLYLHGYLENVDVESIHVIVDAYMKRTDTNLIVLDWGELADGNYAFDAVVNAKQLGPVLAKMLLQQFENGLDIEKFHIVGHSLGGQMAGIVGREIYARSKKTKKIKRISALDPAFPLFYMTVGMAKHLSRHDAEFVDVIHTDAWLYGAPFSTGTADFWPNAGKTLQPGCPKRNYRMLTDNDLSSHRRSWWFWAESVANEYPVKFNCVKAKDWSDFKVGKLINDDREHVVMGHDCPTNISGDYFLQTNGSKPYARGVQGTYYIEPKDLPGYLYKEDDLTT
ncbi:lipase member H-A-like [Musca vetustissima]|uniref:lipase member H-A-like n=1 Tax=Musca vetustissima TaxID=27455 RepID=UPI002AB6B32B|nr:lipase member H-A-like [Musca vetustissima]XP_061388951.1 lipase member H-A-like [Musca vetustissima]